MAVMIASADNYQVLSRIPGRIRLHLPRFAAEAAEWIRKRLRQINGVASVQVNPLTENILVYFDPQAIDEDTLLARIDEIQGEMPIDNWPVSVGQSNTHQATETGYSPVRVMVRGLLGHAVVDSLWFGAGFLGSAMGLPLAGLGPLHVLMDVAVWSLALSGEQGRAT
jgi:copper chaperone CopZ